MRTIFTSKPILGAFAVLLFAICANAQCPPDKFPNGCVVISPEAARQALEDSDTVKAQKAEIAVLNQAIDDFRKELNNMRIEYAATKGELSMCKQNGVSDRAIIDILLKHVKPKKIGLINF